MNDDDKKSTLEPGDENLSSDLNGETAIIAWSELVRHFARGVVIHVSVELDLVETAECLTRDDVEMLKKWLDSGVLRRASDDDARDWTAREPEFWCVVTAPWVLVQEKSMQSDSLDATPPVLH
ncbi:DUF2288 domain-containing protein [Granulosicoccus antarcticus]|uniref:DUF2288 domain-containing protein n=1 Tax=Granulosicoccus antarcticus IMCC3135 TaxID=1192854 RepID=A0A2Z2P381_9GAMM|nr:DUF2288 domain-containing protein [Granulosicoccus antarcticus]ASJ75097.1 hypothetical protein IMCC3135_25170 [Granulosicoccus antarcticus IMCC3135]